MYPIKSDFNALISRLDLPDAFITKALGIGPTNIRNWRKGSHQVPSGVMIELAELIRVLEAYYLWLEKRQNNA